jgi:hypothetical protein
MAACASAINFTWIGEGANAKWKTCDNWSRDSQIGSCWPASGSHDVVFPVEAGGWGTVLLDFEENTIDDLTVREDVDFDGDAGVEDAILTCDTVLFVGGSGGITVTWTADAIITDDD